MALLQPLQQGQDGWQEMEGETRVLHTGDLFVGEADRAELVEAALTLKPPASEVWVDLVLRAEGERPQDAEVAEIRKLLDDFLAAVSPGETLSFQTLAERLPRSYRVSAVRFTLIHVLDGRIADLRDDNDLDRFDPKEQPRVRKIEFTGEGDG